jgi:Rrf2 family iron-sulfur cluster assembly transcriptional regulator
MRLSTKGRYAVMAMTDLARQGRSVRCRWPRSPPGRRSRSPTWSSCSPACGRGGLVKSVRGPGGGYRLARSAAETSVADIVVAVDEPLRATRCTGAASPRGCMASGERCVTHHLWEELGEQIHLFLAGVSLADVLDKRFAPRPAVQTPVAA